MSFSEAGRAEIQAVSWVKLLVRYGEAGEGQLSLGEGFGKYMVRFGLVYKACEK